ncbi:hypothetical protein [Thermohalobacter berrensis]|uniref:hypothetical protein n=1 Tax=Thermohalobacter berrensis TaxID=99594 RepID=UPI000E73D392|nr:hypothetical protein [Thermohalobacter berrensis]
METDKKKDLDYKTLLIIQEQLNHEILLYKKYLNYSHMCYDAELKNICYNSSQKHKKNFEKILSYLRE